jgi:hypothetical protein
MKPFRTFILFEHYKAQFVQLFFAGLLLSQRHKLRRRPTSRISSSAVAIFDQMYAATPFEEIRYSRAILLQSSLRAGRK